MSDKSRLILASGSPRRRSLLSEAGITFDVVVSEIAEVPGKDESPEELAKRLALEKASAVAALHLDAWVLGADTDVSLDGKILGKPLDAADARRMLQTIQGRTHQVWGGFAIVNLSRRVEHCEAHCTLVEMESMDEASIEWYVATSEPLDKAGAYGAQGIGAQFIRSINGSYTNVVGLPINAVMRALKKFGIGSYAKS